MLAIAALLAAAEIGATLILGGFFGLGRAEPLLFFAFRPWMLLAAALIVAGRGWRDRLLLYASALLLAFLGESALLLVLGAGDPWSGGIHGLGAGATLALAFDLAVQIGRRFGRVGLGTAAALALAVLLLPGGLRPYDALVLPDAPRDASATAKPELMLFTALPIIWGEGGAFDPAARPAASFRALEHEFRVRALDVLDRASLGQGRLLLIAQPRALDPGEFVALDAWVRRGGRALILTDPALTWPSKLPLGDLRRPPPVGLLAPLLTHWGLQLDPPFDPAVQVRLGRVRADGPPRRLVMASVGGLRRTRPGCLAAGGQALCAKGAGRAVLIADADLLNDTLWLPEDAETDLRQRTADNPLVVADLLDSLAGLSRRRVIDPIQWIDPAVSPPAALLAGLLPLLLAGLGGLALARVSRG